MKNLIASRIPGSEYDAIVEGVVDSVEYHEDLDEWFAYVYSRDLERDYDFYQGTVAFEPLSEEEVALNLQAGDRVMLGVILADDPYEYGDVVVDILEKVG